MDPAAEPSVITQDDLDQLNRRAALRTIDLARSASWVVLGVGCLLALSWVWTTLRSQGVIGNGDGEDFSPVGFFGEDLSLRLRIDYLAATLSPLGTAFVVIAAGIGVRVYCDVATLRIGGSLTGWELGDSVTPELIELEDGR